MFEAVEVGRLDTMLIGVVTLENCSNEEEFGEEEVKEGNLGGKLKVT